MVANKLRSKSLTCFARLKAENLHLKPSPCPTKLAVLHTVFRIRTSSGWAQMKMNFRTLPHRDQNLLWLGTDEDELPESGTQGLEPPLAWHG
jgi:hypothetical protein